MRAAVVCAFCPDVSTEYCLCLIPPISLCYVCARKHQLLRNGLHLLLPVNARVEIDCRGKANELKRRVRRIHIVKASVDITIRDIKECIFAVEDWYERERLNLEKQKNSLILTLETMKTDLEVQLKSACIESVQDILAADREQSSKNQIAELMKWYDDDSGSYFQWKLNEKPTSFPRFVYSLKIPTSNSSAIPASVNSFPKSDTISEAAMSKGLISVQWNSVWYFDVSTHEWRQIEPSIDFQCRLICPKVVLIAARKFLCVEECYYGRPHSGTWVVSEEGVVRLKDMNEARGNPGVVGLDGRIYVFGGLSMSGKLMDSTETIDLKVGYSEATWETCGQMLSPRRCFNPCLAGRSVYLCGGFDTLNSEVFDIDSETFTALSFRLPEVSDTLAVVSMQGITVITRRHFIVYRPESATTEVRKHYEWVGIAGSTNGVVSEGKVYNVSLGEVNEIDLVSGHLSRYSHF